MLGVEVRHIRAHGLRVGDEVYAATSAGQTHHIGSKVTDIVPNMGRTAFDEWATDELLRVTCENGVRVDIHRLDVIQVWLDNTDHR